MNCNQTSRTDHEGEFPLRKILSHFQGYEVPFAWGFYPVDLNAGYSDLLT